MIDKFWVKFDELDVECFCKDGNKKCPSERKPECKLHVIKFIEIEESDRYEEGHIKIRKAVKKLESELSRTINKFKVR